VSAGLLVADAPVVDKKRIHHGWTLSVLVLAAMAYALSQTLVAPALPDIQRELGTTTTAVTFVLTAYLLSASVATPIVGRLGDMFGKDRMLVVTLIAFGVGSLVAALATSIEVLIVGRAIQGVGGAIFPLAFGIVRDEFPRDKVASGIGLISATFGIGGGVGLLLSGVIVDHLSYHWIFWIGLIVVVVATFMAHLVIPESPVKSPAKIDWGGAALLSAGLISLLVAVSEGNSWGWASQRTIWLIVIGLALLVLLGFFEHRQPQPLVDMTMLARRAVLMPNLTGLLVGFGMFGSFILIPQFVQMPAEAGYGFGASVTEAGLFMLPSTLLMMVGGPLAGWLGTRYGSKLPLVIGTAVVSGAFVFLAAAHTDRWTIYLGTAFFGLGIGFSYAAMANLIIDAVDQSQTGVASGINTIMRTIGGALGAQISASIVAGSVGATGHPGESGFVAAFLMSAIGLAAATAFAVAIPRRIAAAAHSASADVVAATPVAPPPPEPAMAPLPHPAALPTVPVGPSLRGRVLHLEPRPLPAASVTITDRSGRHVAHAYSDADGAFELAVDSPGVYLVHTARNGDRPLVQTVRLGFEPTELEITLHGGVFGICGVIREADGPAVAAATVVALDLLGETLGRTRTHRDGRYELTDLPAGEHTLVVLAAGFHPTAVELPIPAVGTHARDEVLYRLDANPSPEPAAAVEGPSPEPSVDGMRRELDELAAQLTTQRADLQRGADEAAAEHLRLSADAPTRSTETD
jgi:EmrB/QacA subfamily drug resistance transporter